MVTLDQVSAVAWWQSGHADGMRMHPVDKALWFIENRLSGEISLEDIARSVGVSSHYLARAFGAATGLLLMRYARGRRLTEAARSLAAGAPDILEVALAAGYGSEAFTRAFRRQFWAPPEALRANGITASIQLVEPIRMDKTLLVELDPPRFVDGEKLLIAGIGARYTFETNQGIPAQWQRFAPISARSRTSAAPRLMASARMPTIQAVLSISRASALAGMQRTLEGNRSWLRPFRDNRHRGYTGRLSHLGRMLARWRSAQRVKPSESPP